MRSNLLPGTRGGYAKDTRRRTRDDEQHEEEEKKERLTDRFAPKSRQKFIRFTSLSRLSLSYLSLDGLLIISYEHVFLSSFSPVLRV